MSSNGETWIDYNVATDKFHFNADMNQDVRDHLSAANGKFAAEFVSFPDNTEHAYFRLTEKQAAVPNFNSDITGVLFGQGTTNIILFKGGFDAAFDETYITSTDHPLYKACPSRSSQPGWCIERGSSLCFYDSQFFFLKFAKQGERTVHTRWNLPIIVAEKLAELKRLAEAPEEKLAIMQQDQVWRDVARTRRMGEAQATSMVNNMVLQHSMTFSSAPRTVRLVTSLPTSLEDR
ncbi:hypothetical protein B0H17DRAFT_1197153 [Mycena rosella]|uniref:Uncharacterized protein n=1 Tax=Mycena rosella TaxID=1033263 RepID=A0AAD7DR50_MYCRO|nr:hypothetical protein B0H17DRAFT_1197153 [Mycena rosella]